MPDLSLCSEPNQCAACETCRRNPDSVRLPLGEWQRWMKPDVHGSQCRNELEREPAHG